MQYATQQADAPLHHQQSGNSRPINSTHNLIGKGIMSSSPPPLPEANSSSVAFASCTKDKRGTTHDINTGIRNPRLGTSPLPPLSAGVKENDSQPLSSTETNESATLLFDNVDILKQIVSFVGDKRFFFVSAVNRRFKQAYTEVYPKCKTTEMYVSTVELARFCLEEIDYSCYIFREDALCTSAGRHGSIPALQFLRTVNCRWDEKTCARAAYNGHLNVLQWCRENGCPWNEMTCNFAACNGHLNILQWCRENGCPWDELACTSAAKNGHFKVLQWCREKGCPWNEGTCTAAALNGHLHIIQWCREKGCPCHVDSCIRFAQLSGHLNVVQWLQGLD